MERTSSFIPPHVDDLHEVLARSYRNAVQGASEQCSLGPLASKFSLFVLCLFLICMLTPFSEVYCSLYRSKQHTFKPLWHP